MKFSLKCLWSLQVHIGYLTFSIKKTLILTNSMLFVQIAIMQTLDHRGLVRYCKIPDEIQENFSDNNVALGMEFCEQGDLRRV